MLVHRTLNSSEPLLDNLFTSFTTHILPIWAVPSWRSLSFMLFDSVMEHNQHKLAWFNDCWIPTGFFVLHSRIKMSIDIQSQKSCTNFIPITYFFYYYLLLGSFICCFQDFDTAVFLSTLFMFCNLLLTVCYALCARLVLVCATWKWFSFIVYAVGQGIVQPSESIWRSKPSSWGTKAHWFAHKRQKDIEELNYGIKFHLGSARNLSSASHTGFVVSNIPCLFYKLLYF